MKKNIFYISAFAAVLFCMAEMLPTSAGLAASVAQAAPTPPGFEDLAERLLPAVVNVSTTMKIKAPARGELPPMPELPPGSPFEEFFKDFYDQYQNQQQGQNQNSAPPAEEKASSLGSGFVIDAAQGYVVTNNHVIKDADDIKVVLNDNTVLEASLVGTDEKTDIAVLKIKSTKPLTAAVWGDSDKARVGSWVLAIGNPFGLGGTVTAGIVSARGRDINAGPYDQFIQTDASINRGNSGGPMFNMNGEVIGVNTAIFSPSGGSVGIGFAVPSALAKGVVAQLIKYGTTKRGWLGVHIQEVTPEIAESLGLDHPRGAMVSSVTPNGPCDKAGVKTGDVILKFNDHDIKEMHELPLLVAETEVGKKSTLTLWRKGREVVVSVDLGQLEKAEQDGKSEGKKAGGKKAGPAAADATVVENAGFTLAPMTPELRDMYKIPKAVTGVVISAVTKDGAAADKGIEPGDVIVEVDQQEVSSPSAVVDKIAAAEKAGHASVLFFIARRDDMRFVALKLTPDEKK